MKIVILIILFIILFYPYREGDAAKPLKDFSFTIIRYQSISSGRDRYKVECPKDKDVCIISRAINQQVVLNQEIKKLDIRKDILKLLNSFKGLDKKTLDPEITIRWKITYNKLKITGSSSFNDKDLPAPQIFEFEKNVYQKHTNLFEYYSPSSTLSTTPSLDKFFFTPTKSICEQDQSTVLIPNFSTFENLISKQIVSEQKAYSNYNVEWFKKLLKEIIKKNIPDSFLATYLLTLEQITLVNRTNINEQSENVKQLFNYYCGPNGDVDLSFAIRQSFDPDNKKIVVACPGFTMKREGLFLNLIFPIVHQMSRHFHFDSGNRISLTLFENCLEENMFQELIKYHSDYHKTYQKFDSLQPNIKNSKKIRISREKKEFRIMIMQQYIEKIISDYFGITALTEYLKKRYPPLSDEDILKAISNNVNSLCYKQDYNNGIRPDGIFRMRMIRLNPNLYQILNLHEKYINTEKKIRGCSPAGLTPPLM